MAEFINSFSQGRVFFNGGSFHNGEDVLSFAPDAGLYGDVAMDHYLGGTLFLVSASATATVAQWQAALRSVAYTDTSDTPSQGNRNIGFAVLDSEGFSPNFFSKQVTVTAANDAPHGTDATLVIPPNYALRLADFGYGDTDGNALLAVRITTLPGAGTLYLDSNGDLGGGPVAVTAGQSISAADIAAGHLTFVAPRDTSGNGYASLTFQVQDDGGTAAGGVDLDPSPNTLTFNVLDVYDPPATYHATLDVAALGGAGFKLQGDAAFDYAGSSVSGAGDVNGDGFADFIVGAPLNTDTAARQGAAYVIFGHAGGFVPIDLTTPLTATQGYKILGGAVDDRAGFSVSAAGDVNGDGFADIIVGANSNAGGGIGAGAAYVIFGHAGGFGTIDLATMTADEGFKIQGAAARDSVGFNVSAAGDVNGDGFADIIVSAVGSDSGGYNGGGAYVIFGHASGFGTIDLATPLTATQGFQIVGEAAGDVAGVSVSAAGDINGDGFADIIVGAQGNDSGGSFAGAAYVIFGHAGGFGTINLATLTAGEGFKIQGAGIEEYAGRSVSAAGDVNGDGIADIIVGANGNDGGGERAGAAYVLFGHTGAFATIDLAAPLDASQGFKILGDADSDFAGYSVSAAGDFNGDGFADIIVGALGNDSGGDFAGAAYVIFGHASGFGTIDLGAGLTADQGFKIQGEAAGDALSDSSVSAAGDVNGDGFDDIIVGALKNDSGGDRAGAAYVIFGHTSAPTQHANAGLTLNEGATGTVTSAQLDYDDLEQGDSAITYTITSAATNGTLSLSGNALGVGDTFTQDDINHNLVTYHHDGSETTSANFGFSVSDGAGGDVTGQSFAFAINPVNDAPVNTVPADFAISGAEDTSFAITGMQTSDVDADPAAILTVNLLAEHGTLTVSGAVPGGAPYIDGNGTTLIVIAGTLSQINATLGDSTAVQFHGDADYNGTATITLVTSDGGSSGIDPGTTGDSTFEYDADEFSITITPVNDAPVVQNVSTSATEDGSAVTASFSGDDVDSDDDGTTLTYAITSSLAEGSVTNNDDGTFTFNPGSDFQDLALGETRDVTFSYTATDAHNAVSNSGTVTVTVTGVNDAPVAQDVSTSATEDGSGVTASFAADDADSDDDGTTLTYAITSSLAEGSVTNNDDGTFTFNPGSDFQDLALGETRDVTFTYTATDAHNAVSNSGTVTVTVTGTNDAPVAQDVSTSATEDGSAVTAAFAGADVDDGATLTYAITSSLAEGSVTNNDDGTFTFNPGSDFQDLALGETRDVTFSYTATDEHNAVSNSGTVTVTVTGVNDAPVAQDVSASATEDGSAVTASFAADDADSDDDGTTLTYAITSSLAEGSVTNNDDGTFTFNPGSDFQDLALGETRDVTFSYTATDAHNAVSNSGTVTVTVTGVNDAPVAQDASASATEDGSAVTASFAADDADSDDDGTTLTYAITSSLAEGSVTNNDDGTFTFNPGSDFQDLALGETRDVTFSYAATDAHNAVSNSGTVTVTVTGVNDAPVAQDVSTSATEDGSEVTASFAADDADSDDDGTTLTYAITSSLAEGSVFNNDDGTFTFSPGGDFQDLAAGQTRDVTFSYTATDAHNAVSNSGTVTVTVTGVNDAPLFSGTAANLTFTENGAAVQVVTSVSASDVDSSNYSGGTLSASVTAGVHAGDTLSLATSSTPGSGIELSGNDVEYDGTIVGTLTASGSNLSIQLNGSADDTVVQALTEAILISSSSDNPTSATRTVTITLADGGGTANGGQDTATFMRDVSFIAVNDAPSGTDHTITANENTPRALNPVDFAFTDLDNNGFAAVTIASLPTHGTIFYDQDGAGGNAFVPTPILAGTTFTAAQLVGAKLTYRADPGESGDDYATFTYIVRDNGGTANGGQDTDPTANTITIDVNGFNNGPSSTGLDNDGVTFFEDTQAGVVFLDNGRDAIITDLDSADFDTGSLLVHIVVNKVASEDQLVLITGSNGITTSGNVVLVDGVPIGTYTGGGVGEDLNFTLNSGATPESITQLIHNLSYVNTNTVEPDEQQRLVEFRLSDGDGGTMTAFTTVSVVSVDDPATAGNDSASTDEATPVTFNVLGNDDDIDGPAPSIAEVNGVAISVGTPTTLASGALLTLNADGTFTYDPNGRFDFVPAPGSGASNLAAINHFTYTLAGGGDPATVTVTVSGVDSNDTLIGTAGVDNLLGGVGNDVLVGLASADQMTGGTGNDIYLVDNAGDRVVEASGEGFDQVYSSTSYALAAGVEVEVLSVDDYAAATAINLSGNEFGQQLIGNAGANVLSGGGGADALYGLGGDDVLVGGVGGDAMVGGAGNDIYLIDDAGDVIVEAAGEGFDQIYSAISYAVAAGVEVEVLSVDDYAATNAINLTGNEFGQQLFGNAGVNVMNGGGGSDVLYGLGGDDVLIGGAGSDSLLGGTGNDVYLVGDGGDVVVEASGEGFDQVYSSASYALDAGAAVEVLSVDDYAATNAINLSGNEFDQQVIGNAGANVLSGGGGNDALYGLGGDDVLVGGAGGDFMLGGAGNDIYLVDNAGDSVVEAAGEGFDQVYSSTSYALAAGVEVEVLSVDDYAAATAINLSGNEFGQQLFGNAGANVLDGGSGNDTLFGGAGADTFSFTTALGPNNIDTIVDFQSGTDKIILDDAIFDGISRGALGPGVFGVGTVATDEDQRIVYDQTTGNLYYDADGSGAGEAVLFATLQGAPNLTASDFHVI